MEEPILNVLIDTNVFIEREGNWVVPEELQELENLLKTEGKNILIHPLSKEEVSNYENDEEREKAESKIATYAELTFPPSPSSLDSAFREKIDEGTDFNEQVDNALLYAVFCDRVDILITEDRGIHRKASKVGIEDRVFTIAEGRNHFQEDPPEVSGPPAIQKVNVGSLDVDDPIFDSLKGEYDFASWFEGIPDRDAYVNWNPDGTLGAVLILKPDEAERIGDDPELPKRPRLKISTLKVAENRRGSKTGELLISVAIREAINHGHVEIYLTHRIQERDYLVQLISQYGFEKASEMDNGESVFVKRLTPGPGDDPDPTEVNVRFYPTFYDGENVKKFIIPIQPNYHSKLFTAYTKRQPKLSEFSGEFLSEGNAIKKAYLSNANTRKMSKNDILLFYRSHDNKELTSLGVCERVKYGVREASEIREIVGRRSVFTEYEIAERAKSSTTVILFKWHFDLENPIHYQVLRDEDILSGPPQTIMEIDEERYKYVRNEGGIDERFIIN